MILKIAWRNIWRNKSRTLVVVGAVVFGIWGLIFLLGFSNGFIISYLDSSISNHISHIQIHNPKYLDDRDIKYTIESIEEVASSLEENQIDNWAKRNLVSAMISTSHANRSCFVIGVDPLAENKLTGLSHKVKEGEFFDDKTKNQILISERLSKKLKCKIRSKIVLNFQKPNGELGAASFRVKG